MPASVLLSSPETPVSTDDDTISEVEEFVGNAFVALIDLTEDGVLDLTPLLARLQEYSISFYYAESERRSLGGPDVSQGMVDLGVPIKDSISGFKYVMVGNRIVIFLATNNAYSDHARGWEYLRSLGTGHERDELQSAGYFEITRTITAVKPIDAPNAETRYIPDRTTPYRGRFYDRSKAFHSRRSTAGIENAFRTQVLAPLVQSWADVELIDVETLED